MTDTITETQMLEPLKAHAFIFYVEVSPMTQEESIELLSQIQMLDGVSDARGLQVWKGPELEDFKTSPEIPVHSNN